MSKSKIVLGRGLGALIPSMAEQDDSARPQTSVQESPPEPQLAGVPEISVDLIRPNPFQPREDFEPQALEELKQSIIEHGILQPVTVRRTMEGYELVAGERRLRAAKAAGLRMIPAFIKDVESDEELLELALIENVQREHLNPIEVATGYQRLMDECHLTQEQVATKVSKDRATVANLLRLLKLPGEIQDSVRRNELSVGHARAILPIPGREDQITVWKKVVHDELSVRRTEHLVREVLASAGKERPVRRPKAPSLAAHSLTPFQPIESRLRHSLATQVHVRDAGNGKGEIVVEFYSIDELERIVELVESASHDQH